MPDAPIKEVTVDELQATLARGSRLYDVREPAEYAEVRVPGAVLIPLGQVPQRIEEFRGSGPAYLICRSGARSGRACQVLASAGVDAINVAGGTMAWLNSGKPTDSGDDLPTA